MPIIAKLKQALHVATAQGSWRRFRRLERRDGATRNHAPSIHTQQAHTNTPFTQPFRRRPGNGSNNGRLALDAPSSAAALAGPAPTSPRSARAASTVSAGMEPSFSFPRGTSVRIIQVDWGRQSVVAGPGAGLRGSPRPFGRPNFRKSLNDCSDQLLDGRPQGVVRLIGESNARCRNEAQRSNPA